MMDDYFKILKNRADRAGDDGIYEWAFNEIRGLRVHVENLQEELNNQEDLNDMYKEENGQMRAAFREINANMRTVDKYGLKRSTVELLEAEAE